MNERVEILDQISEPRIGVKTFSQKGDYGPVVLVQGQSFTFVSFGLLTGIGAILGLINIWFYLGAHQVIASTSQANQLAVAFALGIPVSSYLVTRLLDLKTLISGEKTFVEYIRTVSFGLWGGLVGGLLILSSFALLTQTSLLALLDAFAVGVPLAQVFGRLGCLNYGCCHGKACQSSSRFGIRYHNKQSKALRYDPGLKGKRLYPTQVYSIIANATIYTIILILALTWESRSLGTLAAVYMTLYGLKRFNVEFLRGEFPRVYFVGLTVWQWFSLTFIILGLSTMVFVFSNSIPTSSINFGIGLESLKSAMGMLILASTILAIAYGTHGRKIGKW